jgi:2-oxo-4-hydroxy-4-carboxy-5-ureidoimidazoline decarboxylase
MGATLAANRVTILELNSLPRERFVEQLGGIFEHSPWVAERAWAAKPLAGIDEVHAAMVTQVEAASRDEQLGLLRAHPDLGTRARMSVASAGEQAGAGLNTLTSEEMQRLEMLNGIYQTQFEFPFIYAVRGATKEDILRALESRLDSSREDEFREALKQVYRIARFRLEATLTP